MKFYIYILFLLMFNQCLHAQEFLHGKVLEDIKGSDQPLMGAYVHWADTPIESLTDNNGNFSIAISNSEKKLLIATYVGYQSDTITVTDLSKMVIFLLKNSIQVKDVEIKGKRDATVLSTIQPRNVELIGEKELLKAACCNLSESFETNPTVDVNYTDAVTGAKEIQMLGLSGIYTQLLTEAIPSMHGLGSVFGLNYIPGPWMESIQVSKGAGSVANGHEAITGQINIEYKKPEEMKEKMFINLFGDADGRVELNTINRIKINPRLNYMLMLHGNYSNFKIDENDDGFLDMPLTRQVNIYNRLRYHSGKKLEGQAGVKFIAEDRLGGQMTFAENEDKGTTRAYGVGIKTRRVEVYTKTGMVYPEKTYKSMGLQLQGTYHQQLSYFGLKNFDAVQKSFYANYAYISMIYSEIHKFRVGADIKIDNFDETYQQVDNSRIETVPGTYAEYTFDNGKRWGIIAGGRIDHHSEFGWFFSPRMHVKYNFTPEVIVRLSGGSGFRTPNIYTDNIGVMASSKTLLVLEKPLPDQAWNGGVNFTARFFFLEKQATFAGDYYLTSFSQQFITDQYSVNDAILFYNLHGSSNAQSLQGMLTYELYDRLDIKVAYKTDNVRTDYIFRSEVARPLFPKEKALLNIAYGTKNEKWKFDATAQWQGQKPLPAAPGFISSDEQELQYSPDYFIYNAQVTYLFKNLDIYFGGENLAGFTQNNPIIDSGHPFSATFNASSIWGPISGRKFYAGIRLKIF